MSNPIIHTVVSYINEQGEPVFDNIVREMTDEETALHSEILAANAAREQAKADALDEKRAILAGVGLTDTQIDLILGGI